MQQLLIPSWAIARTKSSFTSLLTSSFGRPIHRMISAHRISFDKGHFTYFEIALLFGSKSSLCVDLIWGFLGYFQFPVVLPYFCSFRDMVWRSLEEGDANALILWTDVEMSRINASFIGVPPITRDETSVRLHK
jgi:hypothetical protein